MTQRGDFFLLLQNISEKLGPMSGFATFNEKLIIDSALYVTAGVEFFKLTVNLEYLREYENISKTVLNC